MVGAGRRRPERLRRPAGLGAVRGMASVIRNSPCHGRASGRSVTRPEIRVDVGARARTMFMGGHRVAMTFVAPRCVTMDVAGPRGRFFRHTRCCLDRRRIRRR